MPKKKDRSSKTRPKVYVSYAKADWDRLAMLTFAMLSAPQRQAVGAGVDAWRSFDTMKQRWEAWMEISLALEIGEKICAEAAGGKTEGGKFNRLYGRWLKANGLDNIASPIRSWLRTIRNHRGEIETWRSTLPPERRVRLNHPRRVLMGWKASRAAPNTTEPT